MDDHPFILEGLEAMIAADASLHIAAKICKGDEALEIIKSRQMPIDLLITDINMPGMSGIALCRAIKEYDAAIKVLILSMYQDKKLVWEALDAEADGFILKTEGQEVLLRAIHRILQQGSYYSDALVPWIIKGYKQAVEKLRIIPQLTEREMEIITLIVQEKSSKEIAEILHISPKTVENHRQNILQKTGCRSTIGLVKYAIEYLL